MCSYTPEEVFYCIISVNLAALWAASASVFIRAMLTVEPSGSEALTTSIRRDVLKSARLFDKMNSLSVHSAPVSPPKQG